MSIHVTGYDPSVLWYVLDDHHAQRLCPLVEALIARLTVSELGRDQAVHTIEKHKDARESANSFSFTTASGEAYHFRAVRSEGYLPIHVRDRWRLEDSRRFHELRTHEDVKAFVDEVEAREARPVAVP